MASAKNILVVDDDTDAAGSLAELFEMEDYKYLLQKKAYYLL